MVDQETFFDNLPAPNEPPMRTSLQARIAANHSSGTQSTQGSTGNMVKPRAARSFRIKELLWIDQGIHVGLQFQNLNRKLIHCRSLSSFCERSSSPLNCFALSASEHEVISNYFISWQFLARSS